MGLRQKYTRGMNPVASGGAVAPIKTVTRSNSVVAQPAAPAPQVATEVASLSLETKLDLSQKAAVVPPPPPADNRKSKSEKAPPKKAAETVATTDFAGRTCSGTLNGPLLMEEPGAAQGLEFRSIDFVYGDDSDFAALQSAGKALSGLDTELLLKPAEGDEPLLSLSDGSAYYGVKDGLGKLVQRYDGEATAEISQVRLPDGNLVEISRQPGELSIYLPAASLEEISRWGGRLLAEA